MIPAEPSPTEVNIAGVIEPRTFFCMKFNRKSSAPLPMNKRSSIHEAPALSFSLGDETKNTPINASVIPVIFKRDKSSEYPISMSNSEIDILIFTAIEVEATPLTCELFAIIKNNPMNRNAQSMEK